MSSSAVIAREVTDRSWLHETIEGATQLPQVAVVSDLPSLTTILPQLSGFHVVYSSERACNPGAFTELLRFLALVWPFCSVTMVS